MKASRIVSSIVVALFSPSMLLGATATDVINRAGVAEKCVDYRGMKTATIYHNGRLTTSTYKVVHLRPDKTRTEFFTPDDIAGIIIVRDGSECWKYYPRARDWEPVRYTALTPADMLRLGGLKNYSVRMVGSEIVADRPTYVILAVPKFQNEAARRLWVDKDCFVVMKTQVESVAGTVLSTSGFTDIEVNPGNISPAIFTVKDEAKAKDSQSAPGFALIKPSYIPKGYRLVRISTLCVNNHSCAHLQYSNGVNVISLFQQPNNKNSTPVSVDKKMPNTLTWAEGGKQFVLIGNIPQSELQKIANSTK